MACALDSGFSDVTNTKLGCKATINGVSSVSSPSPESKYEITAATVEILASLRTIHFKYPSALGNEMQRGC